MKYEITGSTAFPLLKIKLDFEESIKYETGAMVYHTEHINLKGRSNGGIFKGLTKKMIGNENFFTSFATSDDLYQEIALAPKGIGNIKILDVGDKQYYLVDGSFLASDTSVDYNISRQKGLKNILFGGNSGLFLLKTSGTGIIAINAIGDIKEIELNNETLIIDNGHALAWDSNLKYTINYSGVKTGEYLTTTFTGSGKIYIQTRQAKQIAEMILPFLPQQNN